jgi:Mg2+/Co2+ transporter CorC
MIKVSKEFFELIKSNFGVDFLKKLLLIKKRFINVNFHLALISNKFGGVDSCLQVLEILLEVVGKDKEFFTELTNQIIIPNEIREFLKTNLEIETKA